MKNGIQWVWVGAMVLCGCVGAGFGQSYSGSYSTANYNVSWTININIGRTEIRHLGVGWIPEGFKEVIEGGEGELERIGEGPREVEEGAGVDYRVIDYARDLMRGRFNDETAEVASETAAADRVNRKYRESVVEAAIGAYGLHLQEFPEDWKVVREMAVALLEGRRVADAGKLMYEAYVQDPELGIMPVNGLILGESKEPMMKLVVRAVRAAHREPSAQGWLLVAVLMQAQGRVELAGEMLDRADEFGLDGKISWGLHEALP